jgi:hypothetical protein
MARKLPTLHRERGEPRLAAPRVRSRLSHAWASLWQAPSIPATPLVEEYEQRLMYSADLAPQALLLANVTPAAQPVEQRIIDAQGDFVVTQPQAVTQPTELLIVDAGVTGHEALLNDWSNIDGRRIEVLTLDAAGDGIAQISAALNGRSDISTLHILSHGADGALQLGNTTLDAAQLAVRSTEIAQWGNALTASADILLYGCDVAADAEGEAFVQQLSALTRTDVAASRDLTGNAVLAGNWNLEYRVGAIDAHLAISGQAQDEWFGELAVVALTATKDTQIVSATGNNYGVSTSLILDETGAGLGNGHVLVQFDLSAIPTGATINSATLEMQATAVTGNTIANVYQLTEAWTEGTANGTAGAANWNQRIAGTNWTNAGGLPNSAPVVASLPIAANATGLKTWDLTALAQAWFNGTQVNNGVMLASPDTGTNPTTFDSKETPGGAAPKLVIDYTSNTLIVDTTNDVLDGNTSSVAALLASKGTDSKISLREAIIATNNTAGPDSINLGAGTYVLTRHGGNEDAAAAGDLDITGDLVLRGAGAGLTTIDGDASDRVFEVLNQSTMTFSDLTIQNGRISANDLGSAIYIKAPNTSSADTVTLDRVIVQNNIGGSGAIYNAKSSLTITDSTLEGNQADKWGGGLYNDGGTATLDRVTISNNVVGLDGGGIYSFGGASSLSLTNVTISGNQAPTGLGGGLLTNRSATIVNSTIALNSAASGGGVYLQNPGSVTLKNTILDRNTGGNANTPLTSQGNNIDSDGTAGLTGSGDQSGTASTPIDVKLGPLQNNGGDTATHALLAGSPAINTGSAVGPPAVDQRGVLRDASPDIGAYEYRNNSPAGVPTISGTVTEDQTLTADTSGISDADGLGAFSYQWQRNGVNIAGATASTYTLGDADVGAVIRVVASYIDGLSTAESVTSGPTAPVGNVNDAPVAVADTLAATEDTTVTYTAAQLLGNDTDVDNTNAQLSIASVLSGTGGTVVLNGDGTVTFTPSLNFNGAASFSYTTSDGTATSLPAAVTVSVAAVNDAPVIAVPGFQSTREGAALIFSTANGNAISVGDADAGTNVVQVTLTAGNATLSLGSLTGLSFTGGSGTADAAMTFTGKLSSVNTALNGLSLVATPNLAGGASLQVSLNDLGSSGSGGPLSASASVPVAVAGFFINPGSGLLTGEGGTNATFLVVLRSAPTVDVTISLTSSDATEGAVFAGSLTFTPANWNIAQTVTVFGVDDFLIDGNKLYSVITGPAASGDARYNGLNPVDVGLTNVDNSFAQIVVSPNAGLVTTEAGGTAQFSVVLSTMPAFNVVIPVSSSDPTEGTVAVPSLTFTSANWSVPQVVTVTGVNDFINDGNRAYTVILGAASSGDFSYNGLNPPNVVLSNHEVPNLAPINTVPATQSTLEDTTLVFGTANGNAITVADADAGTNPLRVTLAAVNGVMTLSGVAGLSFSAGANGSSGMTFSGTAASINTALNGLAFQSGLNFNGTASLQISTSDQGNSGTGGALSATSNVDVTAVAVNDAPSAAIVLASYAATEQVSLTLSGTGLSVGDVDAGTDTVKVGVSVVSGTLTAGAGATGVTIGGSGTNSLTLSGNLTQIDNLLAGNGGGTLNYVNNSDLPPASDTLTLLIDDQGNSGGGNLTALASAAINITVVNDAPAVTDLSAGETYTEDTTLNLTDIVVSDVDSANTTATLTLSNTSAGSLTTATSGAVTSTYNALTGVWTASGAIADVNTLLAGVILNPAADFNSNFSIATSVSDGVAPAITGSKAMTGIAVNDAPAATNLNTAETYTEDTVLNLTDIVASDLDSANITATLTLSNTSAGSLTTATSGAVTSTYNALTGVWTAIGALADVNTLLAGVIFNPAADFNSNFTIATSVSDGAASPITGSMAITGAAVNDAPTANVPGTPYSATEQIPLDLKNRGITVSDVDGAVGMETLILTVGLGMLNITAGGSGAIVTGSGTGSVTIVGNINEINNLLNSDGTSTVSYTNSLDTPAASTTLTVQINDSGNTGSGGTLSGAANVVINISAVNDAPVNTVPAAQTVTEDAALNIAGLSINDVDVDGAGLTTQLTVANGTVNVSLAGGAAISAGANGSNTFTLSGTQAQINAALATVGYQGNLNFNGADSLQIVTSDLGNSGAGGQRTDTDTVAITVNPVNDAPLAANTSVTTVDNTAYAVRVSDLGYTDAEGDTLAKIRITKLPGDGTLVLDSNAVALNQEVLAADIASGKLRFVPRTGAPASTAMIGFQVNDGAIYSASSYTISVQITATTAEGPAPVVPPSPTTQPPASSPAPAQAPTSTPVKVQVNADSGASDGGVAKRPYVDPLGPAAPAIETSNDQQNLRRVAELTSAAPIRNAAYGQPVVQAGTLSFTNSNSVSFDVLRPQAASVSERAAAATANTAFIGELDNLRNSVKAQEALEQNIIVSSVATGTAMSVGYVLWLLRGGLLLTSLLSSLPAWRFIDPLPVLGRLGNDDDDDNEAGDDSLESMVSAQPDVADAQRSDAGANSARRQT